MNGLKADIYTLIAALTGGEKVIWSDQNSPRPALPYWTIKLNTLPMLGSAEYGQGVTNDGDQTIWRTNQATLEVQRFGPDSEIKCHGLRSDLDKTTVRESWGLKLISCYDSGPVNNLAIKLDNSTIEPRAAFDMFLRFGSRVLDRVGAIETVVIDGEYPGAESEDLAQVITAASVL